MQDGTPCRLAKEKTSTTQFQDIVGTLGTFLILFARVAGPCISKFIYMTKSKIFSNPMPLELDLVSSRHPAFPQRENNTANLTR